MSKFKTHKPLYARNEAELQKIDYAIQPFSTIAPLGYLYSFQQAYRETQSRGWMQDWTSASLPNLALEKVETYQVHVFYNWPQTFQDLIVDLLAANLGRNIPENARDMLCQLAECDNTTRERTVFRFGQQDIKEHTHVIARLLEASLYDVLFLLKILNSNNLSREQERLIDVYLTQRFAMLEAYYLPEDAPLEFPTIVKAVRRRGASAAEAGAELVEDEDEDDEDFLDDDEE